MILIAVLLAIALICLAIVLFMLGGLPDSRSGPGKKVRLCILISGLCVAGALAACVMINFQERTGADLYLSGGLDSDARQWISSHKSAAPSSDQPGDNIKTLRDGLAFFQTHEKAAASAEVQEVINRYKTLPAHPTRLLNRDEEIRYYEGAKAVYQVIDQIAKQ